MPGTHSMLNDEALVALRRLVQTTHEQRSALPALELVQLANNVKLDSGITIDFTAVHQLGAPMVVVCVPVSVAGPQELPNLTRRENQIAALVAQGLSNKQIARHLNITLATVKDHMHRVLVKTQLPNRAALAAAHHGNRARPLHSKAL